MAANRSPKISRGSSGMDPDPAYQRSDIVLVVDDEPGIIRLCQRLLERAQFTVLAVTNPKEGVAFLASGIHIDLLLVDIRMPGLDGFQVIDLAHHHQPDVAVVIMTGYGTVETAVEALRRGADALILKPFAGAELVQTVKRALQESRRKQDILRLQTLRPLFAISEDLFRQTDPHQLQDLLLETVLSHLQCAHAGLYRPKVGPGAAANLQVLRRVRARGSLPPEESIWWASAETTPPADPAIPQDAAQPLDAVQSQSSERSVVGRALDWGIPVRVDGHPVLTRRGLSSMMAAPLFTSQKDRGRDDEPKFRRGKRSLVLVAARNLEDAPFRELDLEIFAILSRQAAIAMENATLHAELRDYIQQVEKSQQALIKAEKLAIAGRLTASIAHEINNPLQAVQNCLHLAGRKELAQEDRQNYIQMAGAELERLMKTVHRMLDYYRPAAVDRQTVDLNQLILRVLSLLQKQLEDHQVHIDMNLEPDLPAVWAVADQIQQVLLNIILNALEAMPEGGIIYLHSRIVPESDRQKHIRDLLNEGEPKRRTGKKKTRPSEAGLQMHRIGEASPRGIEVIVEDTGPGVEKSKRERVFEPFFSLKEGGTGLGLAISYGIVAAHGGSLDLVTGRARGACFRMVLPTGADRSEQEV